MFESNQTDRSPIVFLIRALSQPASQMTAFAARKWTDGTEVIQRRMFIPAQIRPNRIADGNAFRLRFIQIP